MIRPTEDQTNAARAELLILKERQSEADFMTSMLGLGAEVQLIERLLTASFEVARDPRSAAYRAGARDLLISKLCDTTLRSPFPLGTAQADAWFAGRDEGVSIHRNCLAKGCPV